MKVSIVPQGSAFLARVDIVIGGRRYPVEAEAPTRVAALLDLEARLVDAVDAVSRAVTEETKACPYGRSHLDGACSACTDS